ncbi:MAG: hypothetical protein HY820_16070 [Acidobacteria bacterium]|nr:hypothetical protein [Acidobacteriota bacterium]
MSLEEAILEKVRHLPPAKQEEVLRFADRLQHRPPARMVPFRDRSREIEWLKENRAKYLDQWVVVEGDRLVAADPDGVKAYDAAIAAGIEVPFLIHVLPEDPLPFVPAWL